MTKEEEKAWSNFKELLYYSNNYQISVQFWGQGNTSVFIEKDGVELTDFGGLNPAEALDQTVKYLNRINKVKDEI